MIRILDEIRSRMINNAELFRVLRLIVIKQDVRNAIFFNFSLEELKETGESIAEEGFRRKNTRRGVNLLSFVEYIFTVSSNQNSSFLRMYLLNRYNFYIPLQFD